MESRRRFLKKALYVSPLILTAAVRPAHASSAYGPQTTVTYGSGGGTRQVGGGGGRNSSAWWEFWRRF